MSGHVRFNRVWKAYPRWTPEVRTLRGIVARRMPMLMRYGERRWALRDVSFELRAGESLGLIGPNGAGKSSLLRLAAGLTRPTWGRIEVAENAASILGLGDVFDPTLTGRENALTAMIVAGMRRSAARACLPAVLEFAELEQWIDAPLRVYSDGMKLRLAFGVVAQLKPEVMLIDEVLAVGDLAFQQKCLDHVARLRAGGATLLIASHDLDQVTTGCDRALWLDDGGVRAHGEAKGVVGRYRDAMMATTIALTPPPNGEGSPGLELGHNRFGSQEVRIDRVGIVDAEGRPVTELEAGGKVTVMLGVAMPAGGVPGLLAAVSIHRASDGVKCCDTTTASDGVRLDGLGGRAEIALRYEELDLEPGDYLVEVGVWAAGWRYAYDLHQRAYPLRIFGRRQGEGVMRTRHRWEVGAGRSAQRDGRSRAASRNG